MSHRYYCYIGIIFPYSLLTTSKYSLNLGFSTCTPQYNNQLDIFFGEGSRADREIPSPYSKHSCLFLGLEYRPFIGLIRLTRLDVVRRMSTITGGPIRCILIFCMILSTV